MSSPHNWQNDTELSDLARKCGDLLGFSWQYVAIRVEKCISYVKDSITLHGTSVRGSADITLNLADTYGGYAAALEREVGALDDKQKRLAILEGILGEATK